MDITEPAVSVSSVLQVLPSSSTHRITLADELFTWLALPQRRSLPSSLSFSTSEAALDSFVDGRGYGLRGRRSYSQSSPSSYLRGCYDSVVRYDGQSRFSLLNFARSLKTARSLSFFHPPRTPTHPPPPLLLSFPSISQTQWTSNGQSRQIPNLTRCYSEQPPSVILPILLDLIGRYPDSAPIYLPLYVLEDDDPSAAMASVSLNGPGAVEGAVKMGQDARGVEVGGRIKFVLRDLRNQLLDGAMVEEHNPGKETGLQLGSLVVMKRTKVSFAFCFRSKTRRLRFSSPSKSTSSFRRSSLSSHSSSTMS